MTTPQSEVPVPECTVFLVDDDDGSRLALRFLLELEGLTVRAYSCPEGLLTEGATRSDACLVTDYNMPGMDGLELISTLRKRGNALPAILVTSDPNRTVRDRAAAANVPVIDKLNLTDSLVGQIKRIMKAAPRPA
jgi:two-component system response regulator FixJ